MKVGLAGGNDGGCLGRRVLYFNQKRLEGKRYRSGLMKNGVYRGLDNNGACWLGRSGSQLLPPKGNPGIWRISET